MQAYVIAVLAAAAGVFGTSATSKLRSGEAYRDYRAGLRASRLLSERVLRPAAAMLVVAEVVGTAAALAAIALLGVRAPGARVAAGTALVLVATLIAVLAGGVLRALRLRPGAPCACFGGSRPLGPVHAVRNIGLLVALLAAIPMTGSSAVSTEIVVLAVIGGVLAALLFIRADDLADLFAVAPVRRDQHR